MANSDTGTGSTVVPSVPGVTDATWFNQVWQLFQNAGVPINIWLPIMMGESGGNPSIPGDNGNSIGLFQLNTAVGQGAGYTKDELANPVTNAYIALPAIAHAYQEWGNNLVEVAAHSGHPNSSSAGYAEIYANIVPYANSLFGSNITAPSGTGTGTGSGGTDKGGSGGTTGDRASVNYDFSTFLVHTIIAIVIVVVAISMVFMGFYLLSNGKIDQEAKAILPEVAEVAV